MKIFITGGTGFLGKSVVSRLLKEKHELYILTRRELEDELYNNSKIKLIYGSLENISEWKDILNEIDTVIHMAAPVVFWGEWSMYENLIVKATANIYRYSELAGVNRFIYISSESVLQNKKNLLNIDENEPLPKNPNSFYGKSKMLAEQEILKNPSKMIRIILRPTFIWGSKNISGIQQMIDKVRSGQFMWINHGKPIIEMVHVENVAESIRLATTRGTDGQIYLVTDDNPMPVKNFLTDILGTQGVELPEKSIPFGLAWPLSVFIEKFWKVLNLKNNPLLTRFDLSFIAMSRKYNISKIKKDLGYVPIISYQKGLTNLREGK